MSEQLLAHLEPYGVVVCKSCQFCIQPSAFPSHLLRHRIYRNERRQLLQRLSKLKLLEPEEVPLPSDCPAPLPHLAVNAGHRCEAQDCDHACVSSKRMSQHWSEQHGEHDSKNVKARKAYLQTFFRGNKIRYFEVSGPGNSTGDSGTTRNRAENEEFTSSGSPSTAQRNTVATSSTDSTSPDDPSNSDEPSVLTLDMTALRYFHHYTIDTSLTLRRSEAESEYFWKVEIPQQALQYPFLMFAILGLSAIHLAVQAIDNPSVCQRHRDIAIQYQSAALVDFRSAMRLPDAENSTALIAFGRFFGVQRCVEQQLEWILQTPSASTESDNDMSKLLEFFFLLRGGHEMMLTVQHLLPPDSDFVLSADTLDGIKDLASDRQLSLENVPVDIIARLTALPGRLSVLLSEADVEELQPAIDSLWTAISLAYGSPDTRSLWDAAEGWLRFLPDQYIHQLSAAQPGALVVFAHWLIIAKRLESRYWFCKGQGPRLLGIVMANLPTEEWRALVSCIV